MNAKTTKFLAVFAVLAMAFAAVTVLTSTGSDAESDYSVWAFAEGKKTYITLGADVIIPTDGQVLEDDTAYYVTEDMTLNLAKDTALSNGGILIFLKKGVEVTVVAPEDHENTVGVGVIGVTESTDSTTGDTILTCHNDYTNVFKTVWADADNKIVIPKVFKGGIDQSNASIGHDPAYHGEGGFTASFYEGELNKKPITFWSYTDVELNWTGDVGYFFGENYLLKDCKGSASTWYFVDSDATISSYKKVDGKYLLGDNMADLSGFNGTVEMNNGTITIKNWLSGNITVTKGTVVMDSKAYMPVGSKITFLEGTYIGNEASFQYKDQYNDIHSFLTTNKLDVGMGDLTISAVDNMIVIDGTVTLTAETTYSFTGNATLSGMVYTKPIEPANASVVGLILKNTTKDRAGADAPADIKLRTFQVTDGGAVTLTTSVLVETGCSFYVSGDMTIGSGAVLKIAEGAVVKPEGELTVSPSTTDATSGKVTPAASIWNAGQFIATNYDKEGKYFDKQLIRVFMNTGYQTGTFYLGSSVYDGTITTDADDTVQSPLKVAFGSYIDMTGIDKVNLTSGGIDVNNALYKYKTLILATYNNTIALTATFDNQYPVTVALDGKSASAPVMTAKSATISNVVWQSPISATIYVTAPEVYTVELAKTLTENSSNPVTSATKWSAADFTVKDQNGRVIPISDTGQIKVVFGYQYTIEGANSTSNYKFFSPNGELTDLTKVDKTKGTFTMIRNNLNITNNGETPVVLYITEGFAVELTVYLDDDDKKYSEGEVFMYYNIANDAGKVVGDGTPVTVQFDDDNNKVGIITGIYSNDEIYFKSEFVKFFKSTAIDDDKKNNIKFPGETVDATNNTPVVTPVPLDSEKWGEAFTFTDGITKTVKAASFTLLCDVNTVKVYFTFGTDTTDSQKITVDFEEYCVEAGHKETVTTKRSDTPQVTNEQKNEVKWQFYIEMAVGEVYKVSWSEVNNYISKMTYSDKEPADTEKDDEYESGKAVTAKATLYYTLSEEQLKYIIVENQTDLDLTLSIGKFSADIASKKSNSKVIVNDDDNTLILSKKGYTVNGWDFSITRVDKTAAEPTIYVSGAQTTQTFKSYNTSDNGAIAKITIINVDADMTRYFVNVLKDDHGAIDPFDQNGYMGDERKAYVTTQFGYTVIDVLYEYQEVDMTEKAVGHATKGYTPEGVEVWTYTMPASNVLLKPVILKDTRMLSFVDQNGETIAETITVTPLTPVDMAVPCKPLYRIVEVTTEPTVEGFNYNPETGNMTFTMPDADVKVIVTCEEIQYSEKLLVTVGQEKSGEDINVVLYALDGKAIGPGEVTIEVWYTYINEFGDVSVDYVDVTLTYEASDKTVAVLTDDTFIEELGENYSGAYAVTGEYVFGVVEGELSTTEYKPVEA